MSYPEVMAFVREADVKGLSSEKEFAFVQALCEKEMRLIDARTFLRKYLEKTSSLYFKCLEYMLDNSPTLFTFALSLSRGGWHRRYKNRKYLCNGTPEEILALQKRLLAGNIRLLFAYAVNYNIGLFPEVLAEVKGKAIAEAVENGIALEEQIARKGVTYAAIYNHQANKLDCMRTAKP